MNHLHAGKKIIVIAASSGGIDAIKGLVSRLPKKFLSPIFIVWHMAPDTTGILPQIINQLNTLPAAHAIDKQPIEAGRIYVAPPDKHMLLENNLVRVSHGPKENRFRPAADPLFRSAAQAFGDNVVGIVLSGALDDGTAGLWTIKRKGGIAIVQEPSEAAYSSMPVSALTAVNVDYHLPVSQIAQVLMKLDEGVEELKEGDAEEVEETEQERIETEIKVGLQQHVPDTRVLALGDLSPFACPECHGALAAIKEGKRVRYRCHTGHAFSSDSLLYHLGEAIENSLWNAVRATEESVFLLNQLGDQYASVNKPALAAVYFQKAKEATERSADIRNVLQQHEVFSQGNLELGKDISRRNEAFFTKKDDNQPA